MSVSPNLQPVTLASGIGVVLAEFAEEAEAFGAELCLEPEMVERYHQQLQFIDKLAQSLRELSHVLRSDDPRARADNICLDDLQERLAALEAA